MQFGGAQPSEPSRVSKSFSKRANELLYFLRLPLQVALLDGRRELVCRDPVKPFLGARGLCLPLGSGKDSQPKLSYRRVKTGPFSRLITAQSQIFFCPGRRPGSPYDAARGHRKVSFSCVYLLLMAQCAVSADSSYFIARTPCRTRLTHRLAYCPYGLA